MAVCHLEKISVARFLCPAAGVSPGYVCWCWKPGQWDELEEEKLEEIFVICWEWGERGKGDHRLQRWAQNWENWTWRSRSRGVALPSAYLSPWQEGSLVIGC